jgi:DNA transformation protein
VSAFIDHCLDLLATLGEVRARAMMGGHMLYAGALPVALLYDERLYLKVDAATRELFTAAGGEPFTYELRGRVVEMSFVAPPDAALEAPEDMAPWARLALEAARRAAAAKRPAAARRPATTKLPPAAERPAQGRGATAPRGTSGTRRRSPGRSRR